MEVQTNLDIPKRDVLVVYDSMIERSFQKATKTSDLVQKSTKT